MAGLRRNEIDKLQWSAFRWNDDVIRIEETEHFAPKSSDGAGDVEIDQELLAMFRGWQAKATGAFVIEADAEPRSGTTYAHYRRRIRERPSAEENWALQQRKERDELVDDLKQENLINSIAKVLESLDAGGEEAYPVTSAVSGWARQLAEMMVAREGIVAVVVICSYALSRSLRFALQTLGITRATIYRRLRRPLRPLRARGEKLCNYDLSQVFDPLICRQLRCLIKEQSDNAWSVQTTFSPENLRAIY